MALSIYMPLTTGFYLFYFCIANWNAPKLYEKFVFSSLKSCENLLLSTWKPQTYEDLERHDRLVMDKWERIILHKNTSTDLKLQS